MTETMPQWKQTLRWIAFLPVAIIAAVFAQWALRMLNELSMEWSGLNPYGFWSKLGEAVISSAAMGATFVYVGARIAPAKRTHVAYVLTVIAILFSGFASYPAIAQHNWWALIACLATVAGAVGLVYSVASGELDLDAHNLS